MSRRGLLVAPLALLLGMLWLVALGAAQTRISPDELTDRLRRAQELARLDDAAPSPERMEDLRAAIGLPVEVAVGEWVGTVPSDPILDALAGSDASDFEVAAARVAALERSLADALARGDPDASRISAALGEAYRGVVPPQPNLPEAILRVIGEVIEAVLQRIGNVVADAGNVLAWVALIAIGAFAVMYLLRARLVPDRVSEAGRTGRAGAGSVDWAARAEEALRAGDLQGAVRALYLSMLAVLAGRGIVADAPALTAGEARLAVRRARPGLFPAIARATDSYERVVYGGATPDRRHVEDLREATAQARRP